MKNRETDLVPLREYLRILRKRKWVIITCFVVVATIVTFVTISPKISPKIYEAEAQLCIETMPSSMATSAQFAQKIGQMYMGYMGDWWREFETQCELITRRAIAREVFEKLALFNDPEFQEFKDNKEKAISAFLKMVKVETQKRTKIVRVSIEGKNPKRITEIVNTLVETYKKDNKKQRVDAMIEDIKALEKKAKEEKEELILSKKALREFDEKHNIPIIMQEYDEIAVKLSELNNAQLNAQQEVQKWKAAKESIDAVEGDSKKLETLPIIQKDEALQQLKKQEGKLIREISEASKKYKPRHPKMVPLQSKLETIKEQMRDRIETIIASVNSHYKDAQNAEVLAKEAYERQKKGKWAYGDKIEKHNELDRDVKIQEAVFDNMIETLQRAEALLKFTPGSVRITDYAVVPDKPIRPKTVQNIALGMIVGILLGIGLAFLLEHLDNTIKTPEEAERFLGLPTFGVIPAIDGKVDEPKGKDLICHLDGKSSIAEAYRTLRTTLSFSSLGGTKIKTILITSAIPKEGKTITSTNLGVTLAQEGSKVLLIDADMRNPRIHKIFSVSSDSSGLVNLLVGDVEMPQVLQHTEVPNLDVVVCGPIPPNPSELLGSSRFAEFIKEAKGKYDKIIIDSPPVLSVTDACVVSSVIDGVLQIIKGGETQRELALRGKEQLSKIGTNVLGVVINDIKRKTQDYYYSNYYYYYYSGKEKKKKHKK